MTNTTLPQRLGERYQLLELLGVGGMAEIYRARMAGAEGFTKTVVIKRLLPQYSRDPDIVAQFIGEARLAALLHHDNIADIYDFGESEASYYIAMEHLVGWDLHSVLRQAAATGLGLAPSLFIAAAICAGMDYAHRRTDETGRSLGIIHRDLSPHNIFISTEGVVKIIDFGVAKAELYDHRTQPGMVKGKISYMSPEQLAGEEIDQRSDIFTIGILLYEMLTGEKLYSGDTATLLRKGLTAEYRDVAEILPALPPSVSNIVRRALSRDLTQRYQSCDTMRADLEECLFAAQGRYGSDSLRRRLLELFPGEVREGERVAALSLQAATAEEIEERATVAIPIPTEERARGGDRASRVLPRRRPWLLLLVMLMALGMGLVTLGLFFTSQNLKKSAPSSPENTTTVPAASPALPAPGPAAEPVGPRPQEETSGNHSEIAALLEEARSALQSRERVGGGEAVALAAYRRIQSLSPGHGEAEAGLASIAEGYGDAAEQALRAGRLPQAGVHLRRGLAAFPGDGRLLQLQQRFERQRREAVERLAASAEAALADNRLSLPADDNALKYYKEIEQLEGRSPLVSRGLAKIVDRYAALGEEAYRNLQREKCREYVRLGLAIDPRHRQLLQLQKDLQRSGPGMFFKSLEKSFRPLFNR